MPSLFGTRPQSCQLKKQNSIVTTAKRMITSVNSASKGFRNQRDSRKLFKMLHPHKEDENKNEATKDVDQNLSASGSVNSHATVKDEVTTVFSQEQQGQRVVQSSLLLTASTKIGNTEDPSLTESVQIFFDTGAQRSFITTKLSEKLKLATDYNSDLLVHTFGSQKPMHTTSNHVKFDVLLRDGSHMQIEADALSHLTNDQKRAELTQEDKDFIRRFLPSSFFADLVPFEKMDFKPSVIIGQDYFWEFFTDAKRIKLPSGLYAIPSKLGLFLGGQ